MYTYKRPRRRKGYYSRQKFEPFDTQKHYKQAEGYTHIRKKYHENILASYLDNQHIAVLIGGGSGAGKSSAIKKFVLPVFMKSFILIDADEIKEHLPEYGLFKKMSCLDASDYVHEESSDVAKMLIARAIQNKRSFIYDATMSNYEKYTGLIENLKSQNYHVHILFIDTDVDIALERVAARFLNEDGSIGRYVSEDVVRETNFYSAETFLRIYGDVNGYTLINNDDKPTVLATDDGVENPYLFDLFLKKVKYLQF